MPATPFHSRLFRDLARALTGQTVELSAHSHERILERAQTNGVGPLLAYRCGQGTVNGVRPKTVAALKENAQAQAARDLALNHDTRQMLDHLASVGLRCLLLKGTPLSLLSYPQPYLRERCDTDLYISIDDVQAVTGLLQNAGYTIHGLGARPQASKQFQASTRTNTALQSTFDIHYRLSNRVLFADTLPFAECWEHRQPVPALGESACALSNIDLLIHACIHRIAHGRGTERNRLIWLYDIHLLWTALDEQAKEAFIEKALDKKIGAVCADALNVCEKIFSPVGARHAGEDEPIARMAGSYSDLLKNVEKEPTARLIEAGKLRWAWADLMATPGLKNKLQFAGELVRNKM